eukprot:TRINITY_DN57115_c0_g1_i1.p1 TRINITY_DN57115_c0_g1~~TRINITY_DN57115_c0_g1_i1.p1  ORF type:complete len:299 (+),score=44.10 TRINITY_DN57115_c0_g1_i1:42-938(+)
MLPAAPKLNAWPSQRVQRCSSEASRQGGAVAPRSLPSARLTQLAVPAAAVAAGACRRQAARLRQRPRLLGLTELVIRKLLQVVFGGEAVAVKAEARSNRAVLLGQFDSLKIEFNSLARGFRLRRTVLQFENANFTLKPTLLLLAPVLMVFSPSLLLPLLLVCMLPLGKQFGQASTGLRSSSRFSTAVAADDLNRCKLWRFLLTAALRDIMSYSVAGLVALPREVSGELSAATSFELEDVQVQDAYIVMGAVAHLPDNRSFKYKLRTSATLGDVDGSQCIIWEDPGIEITPGHALICTN